MKKILTSAVAFLFMVMVVYAIGSISTGSFTISEWTQSARETASIILIFTAVFILIGRGIAWLWNL